MRDLFDNTNVLQVLHPVVSTATKTSSAIDLQGYNSALVLFAVGLDGDTLSGSVYWTLKLQESDDDSLYTDVTSASTLGGVTTVTIDANSKDRTTYKIGYVGNKRYLKGIATPTGTHTNGVPLGIVALRSHAGYSPVS